MVLEKLLHLHHPETDTCPEIPMTKITAATRIALALMLVPLQGAAQEALASLDELLQGIRTLTADVTQLIVESDGGILEESDIRMQLKKPDGFYWETISPFPELIVTNGKLLWNYQPDLEQVVIEAWDTSRSELAAQLLNGQTENLAEEYEIQHVAESNSEHTEFRLLPLASDNVYREITISFVNTELDMIYLNSKSGQKTVWQFINVQRNAPLADALFEFVPPDGVDVIENTYINQ